jgi:MtrB/PioB family decaheme-associated outer membrane protein
MSMNRTQLSVVIAALFAASSALAQEADPFLSKGQVEAGGIVTDSSTKDASKFQEYQDLNNGMLSNAAVQGRNKSSWINFYGENFGRDDMYIDLRGGMYDVFKARAYTNWLPHNFLFNGATPYAGSGGNALTATFPQANPSTWNGLNLGYERKDTGGYFEWQQNSPWYVRVDGNQIKFNGTKVGSASNGSSPGNGYVDLALPVQTETNTASVEGGYASRTLTVSASYLTSNFGNENQTVSWNNPFWGNNIDRTSLAPSNNYQRFAMNATWRQLPLNSTLAARYTWDKTTTDTPIYSTIVNGAGASGYLDTSPNANTFNGNEQRQTFTLGWAATPLTNVDTRVYYNWQKMNNDGNEVTFCASGAASCGGTFSNELLHYEKQNVGADAYWKITRANRVGLGYDWYNIKQNRPDFDNSTNNTIWAEWKNTSLDTLSFRAKYSYLQRRSDFLLGNEGTGPSDPAYLERFVKAFDLANVNQNRVKLTADWSPSDNLGFGFEYIFKNNDYADTTLGRQNDKRNEFYANMTYGAADSWRVSLFGDYEDVRYNSYHRNVGSTTCSPATAPCFDPNAPPTSSAYNWGATVKNNNWLVGVGLDWPINEKILVSGSFLYEQTDGSADMNAQNNYGNPLPFANYPNTKITSLNLKGVWKANKNWSVTGGYAYQKYDYNDDQFAGYSNIAPVANAATNTSLSYLNGWNAYQSYNANIFYVTLKFAWDPPILPIPAVAVAEAPAAPAPRAAPAAAAAPAPAPAPAAAPAPQLQRITLDSKVLFDFDKAVLKPEGKSAIDSQVVGKLAQIQKLEVVLVTGHTDRIGTDAYNQKLSIRRADAVRDYLVSKGVDKAKIETIGMGEKQPVVQCDQKNQNELIACLAPNRRVEVQVKGDATK